MLVLLLIGVTWGCLFLGLVSSLPSSDGVLPLGVSRVLPIRDRVDCVGRGDNTGLIRVYGGQTTPTPPPVVEG